MANNLIGGVLIASAFISVAILTQSGEMTPEERKSVYLKAQSKTLNEALTVNAFFKRELFNKNLPDWSQDSTKTLGKIFYLRHIEALSR
jgi:hypothetical protein